jgi:hypothetical protein
MILIGAFSLLRLSREWNHDREWAEIMLPLRDLPDDKGYPGYRHRELRG